MAQFTNRASISYNGVTADSNIVTGEIVQVLTAEKTVLPTTYRSGDVLTYAVSIANSGTTPITGLTLTDDLGAYNIGAATAVPLSFAGGSVLYYVNGALQAAPAVTPGAPLVISGISVPAGGSALIVYRAQVTDFAPPAEGGVITNRALISGGGLSEPVAATAAANAEPAAALEIIKALRPTTVTENGELFYTFTIQNSEVLTVINGSISLLPCVLYIVMAILLFALYDLDDIKHQHIVNELDKRRRGLC